VKAPALRGRVFVLLCIAGSISASYLFSRIVKHTMPRRALPVHGTLTEHLTATERSGQEVTTAGLRGKVCVVAFLYTVCHHGCAAVLAELTGLNREHGHRSDFQIISLAVVPQHDTPEFFRSYAAAVGVQPSDPWWFLSGDGTAISRFTSSQLKLMPATIIPEEERLNPLETHSHDLRIVLLDRLRRVRGYYTIIDPLMEVAASAREQLQADTRTLLEEP